MTDRPILFSAPMVRALLAGTKTQTRRILKPQSIGDVIQYGWSRDDGAHWTDQSFASYRLRIWAGDRLWVRETWQGLSFGDYLPTNSSQCEVRYAATDPCADLDAEARGYPWRPSIFMPRWASRLTLTVTDVRIERLQDISEADARAEGINGIWDGTPFSPDPTATNKFTVNIGVGNLNAPTAAGVYRMLWEWINGEGSWEANPWVVAYTFTVHAGNIDQIARAA